jgi:hypothetical protein
MVGADGGGSPDRTAHARPLEDIGDDSSDELLPNDKQTIVKNICNEQRFGRHAEEVEIAQR